VILDLPHFVQAEKPYWGELQAVLQGIETEPEFEREIPCSHDVIRWWSTLCAEARCASC
jgi:hypothetical protein